MEKVRKVSYDLLTGIRDGLVAAWHVWYTDLENGDVYRWLEFVGILTCLAVAIAWLLLQL
jgi:hypothetical protein